jgi:hypothetical protein
VIVIVIVIVSVNVRAPVPGLVPVRRQTPAGRCMLLKASGGSQRKCPPAYGDPASR